MLSMQMVDLHYGMMRGLMQVICERGSKICGDTLAIMPYMDATIKEALRLGAIINIVPKRALKTFEIGGYTIPKASLAFKLPLQAIHAPALVARHDSHVVMG